MAVAPDGTWLAIASGATSVEIWDAITSQQVAVLTSRRGLMEAVVVTPDGIRLVTADSGQTLHIRDLATCAISAVMRVDRPLRGCAWSPSGQLLAVVGDAGLYLFALDPSFPVGGRLVAEHEPAQLKAICREIAAAGTSWAPQLSGHNRRDRAPLAEVGDAWYRDRHSWAGSNTGKPGATQHKAYANSGGVLAKGNDESAADNQANGPTPACAGVPECRADRRGRHRERARRDSVRNSERRV